MYSGCGGATIANGEIDYLNGTDFNAVAKVLCSNGYRQTGSDTIQCLDSGVWDKGSQCIIKGEHVTENMSNVSKQWF